VGGAGREGAVPVGGGGGGAGPPKNRPLSTALGPPVSVKRRVTCPVTFQTKYSPLTKVVAVCVFKTVPVPVSSTSTRSVLARESQSRTYSATWCGWLSVKLTSTEKVVVACQLAAMRSAGLVALLSARTSEVEAAQVELVWPVGVTWA